MDCALFFVNCKIPPGGRELPGMSGLPNTCMQILTRLVAEKTEKRERRCRSLPLENDGVLCEDEGGGMSAAASTLLRRVSTMVGAISRAKVSLVLDFFEAVWTVICESGSSRYHRSFSLL